MVTSSARPAPSTGEEVTIVLSGVGSDVSDAMLMNMYRTYGPIIRVKHNGTNSAHVVFAQKRHALNAVKATNGAVVYGKMLKVSLQRPFQKTTEPCRGFAKGICQRGDMCKYYHVTDDASFDATAPPVVATKRLRKPTTRVTVRNVEADEEASAVPPEIRAISDKKLCRFFSRGFCSQGKACTYAHVLGLPIRDAHPEGTGKVAKLCMFFQNGVCGRGSACRFIHTPKAGTTPMESCPPESSLPESSSPKSLPLKAVAQSSSDDQSEPEPLQKNNDRICAECEKPGTAMWECPRCEDSLYCDECNSAVHSARVMSKHVRKELPLLPKLPRCIECESATASVRCEQCESTFCVSCDTSVHKFKSLRKHVRVDLSSDGKKISTKMKEPQQEHIVLEKSEKKKNEGAQVENAPRTKLVDTVPYVESVPQLEFSSDSDSSEDEEVDEPLAMQPGNSHLTIAATSIGTESEEDFDDVKLPVLAQITSSSAVESTTKVRALPVSVRKVESASDSDSPDDVSSELTRASTSSPEEAASSASEDDNAPSKSSTKLTRARKPALAEISSESESDSDNDPPSILVVKRAKEAAQKTKSSLEFSGSSKDSASTKAVEKKSKKRKTSASEPTGKKLDSASTKAVEKKSKKRKTSALEPTGKKLASASSLSRSSSSEGKVSWATPATKGAPVSRRAPVSARNNKAEGISTGSSHTLVKKIEAFKDSGEPGELHLNANLNGFERLLAHDCAERLGLAHESTGSGLERHIIISHQCAKRPAVDSGNRSRTKKSKHNRH